MVWERETPRSDDDRLADRFTETPRARAARIARKRIDPSTRRAVLDVLKGETTMAGTVLHCGCLVRETGATVCIVHGAPPKNRAAVALGRRGGSVTSPAKAKAARRNGRKGGRPRKVLDVLPTRDGVELRFRPASKSKRARA